MLRPRNFCLVASVSASFAGQRSLERPTILVTQQRSLSDAEDFTQGHRAMHLGKVVGEPTADGKPMELHPRPVDLLVKRPMGESYTGHDVQLDAAVRKLLKQIPANASRAAGSE
jgi:tricorn protease